MKQAHRLVIIGGGFGGLTAAQALKGKPLSVTLIDRRNFHLFQPLLYQVATGGLAATNISSPLRDVLKTQRNTSVILGNVTGIDARQRLVRCGGREIPYDTLVVAAGSDNDYLGHDQWEKWAPSLKSIEDATEVRRRVLLAFEHAETETDPVERRKWLRFVIVGGGPTGVELAGAIAELAKNTLRDNFRNFNPADAEIILLEGMERILPSYPPPLSAKATAFLRDLGVFVHEKSFIINHYCPIKIL